MSKYIQVKVDKEGEGDIGKKVWFYPVGLDSLNFWALDSHCAQLCSSEKWIPLYTLVIQKVVPLIIHSQHRWTTEPVNATCWF